jgi:uncharacterized protein (DUF1800 family)
MHRGAPFLVLLLAACRGHTPMTAAPLPPAIDTGRELATDQQVHQALARLTFGPRPGDVARVRAMGVDRWIATQLTPDRIDDHVTEAFVAAHFATAVETPARLVAAYPPPDKRRRQIAQDLQAGKIARAVASDRQLQEVMVDFWENHFNVFAGKGGPELYLLPEFDRAAIRPYVLGHFRDLLGAVAKSPAMLYYLDNARSSARGLNENYGRELLELHTLGVDGGYTQQDVIDVARAFTGWSIRRLTEPDAGTFLFRPAVHDAGEKHVLGVRLAAGGGMGDGEAVLDIVAHHPSTARFIARKLCVRFVSDTPPPDLVARAAATFTGTGGDIRQVVWTIVTSREFFSRSAYRAKVKTPFDVVVSAMRALGAAPDSTPRAAQLVARLGEPLYGHPAPNGYAETGDSWMNTGAILARINFGLAFGPTHADAFAQLASAPRDKQVDAVVAALLDGEASPETRHMLLSDTNLAGMVGSALGTPEFQRH